MRNVELPDIQTVFGRNDLELDRAFGAAVEGSHGFAGQAIQSFLYKALVAPQPGCPGHDAD